MRGVCLCAGVRVCAYVCVHPWKLLLLLLFAEILKRARASVCVRMCLCVHVCECVRVCVSHSSASAMLSLQSDR